jgi:hypothetical protein
MELVLGYALVEDIGHYVFSTAFGQANVIFRCPTGIGVAFNPQTDI